MSDVRKDEIHRPYDASLENNLSMYDKLPYKRDIDLCNASSIAMESGNLIKYYRCAKAEDVEIKNQDAQFSKIALKHIEEYEKESANLHEKFPNLYSCSEINSSEKEEPAMLEKNT